MGLVVLQVLSESPDACGHSLHVHVHGEYVVAEAIHHHAECRFRSHPGEVDEEIVGFSGGHASQASGSVFAASHKGSGQVSGMGSPLVGQPPVRDAGHDLRYLGFR